jgi:predicted Zn-dependent protease
MTTDGEVTLAEALGLTEELGSTIARIAEAELEAGRIGAARTILEGLVVSNPKEPLAWVLLARAHRAEKQPLAARFCAEVAGSLAPDEPMVRLARAEGLLPYPEERSQALQLLGNLAAGEGAEADRARRLLAAAGG